MKALLCVALILFTTTLSASQIDVNNPTISKQVVLEETGDVLNLQGVARHKKFFRENYIAALYANQPLGSPSEALSDPGPKKLMLYFLLPTTDLKKHWKQAIRNNNSPETVRREQLNISDFLRIIDVPLQKGDVIMLDYIPKVGTKMSINGAARGLIKGDDFFTLVLKIWLGRQPPSEKFRKDLLNLTEGIHMGQLSR